MFCTPLCFPFPSLASDPDSRLVCPSLVISDCRVTYVRYPTRKIAVRVASGSLFTCEYFGGGGKQRCLASLLVAQCSLGTDTHSRQPSLPRPTVTARAAWSRRRTASAAAFLVTPPTRPGDSSSGGGSLEHLLRVLRLDDAIFALHQQPRQHPRRGEHVTAAVAAAAYNNIGRPPLTCWSKDQWTPRRDVSKWPSQRSHRQRSTRLTSWSKCQWSPTSYQPPVWRTRSSQRGGSAAGVRWQAGGGGGRRARDWSKVQWSPLDDGDSRGTATRLQGQGGVGGGAGAGAGVGAAGAGGGGAFNRVSFPPPPAASAAIAAGIGGRGGFQGRGASSTVSRPAVAAATVGSTGPKDLSGAPVEVRGGR